MISIFVICVVVAVVAFGMIGWLAFDQRQNRKEIQDYFREKYKGF